jgi:hypothetical protein
MLLAKINGPPPLPQAEAKDEPPSYFIQNGMRGKKVIQKKLPSH